MSGASRAARGGFTLIEVLLTTVLAAVLLVALWSLLSMYSRTFESGQFRTEQAQLARTLLEQVEVDLQAIVQSPPKMPALPVLEPPPPPAAAEQGNGSGSSSAGSSPSSGSSGGSSAGGFDTTPAAGAAVPVNSNVTPLTPTTAAVAPLTPQTPGSSVSSPQPIQPIQPLKAAVPQNPTPNMPTASPAAPASSSGGSQSGSAVATTSLRAAGLFGTSTYLQIDVVQPALVDPVPAGDMVSEFGHRVRDAAPEAEMSASGFAIAPSKAEDLKSVVYSFEELGETTSTSGEPTYCLFRRELDWEQAHPAAGRGGGSSAGSAMESPGEAFAGTASGSDPLTAAFDPAADESIVVVPEVLHFAIRYFDGAAWSEEWDSHARGGLPRAVEVTMRLRGHDEPNVLDAPTEGGISMERLAELKHPLYRTLVVLSGNVAQARTTDSLGAGPANLGGAANVVPGTP